MPTQKVKLLQTLREMTEVELHNKLKEEKNRLKKIKFAHAVSPIDNPMIIRNLRKDIARIFSELETRERLSIKK